MGGTGELQVSVSHVRPPGGYGNRRILLDRMVQGPRQSKFRLVEERTGIAMSPRYQVEFRAKPREKVVLRVEQHKLFDGTREAHIRQSPVLLECVDVAIGEYPTRQPNDRDHRPLQSFGTMER